MLSKLSLTLLLLSIARSEYVFPKVELLALSPMGLKASVPAENGMKLFGFHAKVNSIIGANESGDIDGDVSVVVGDRMTFVSDRAILKSGDTLYYWIYVQDAGGQHKKSVRSWRVPELVPRNSTFTPPHTTERPVKFPDDLNCLPSITKLTRSNTRICKDKIIFEERFGDRTLDHQKWTVEQRLADINKENGFMSYQGDGVSVSDGMLKITPSLLQNKDPFDEDSITSGVLDLTLGCTSQKLVECRRNVKETLQILPPVVTGKITTRNKFSFLYGKVEIRAKLPQGDWLYPELYLEPEANFYGPTGYDSGLIRIAFCRGNMVFNDDNGNYDNTMLSGGLILSRFEPCRSRELVKVHYNRDKEWGNDFHVYSLIWNEDEIRLSVDGEEYGVVRRIFGGFKKYDSRCRKVSFDNWGKGGPFAPFDREMHLTIGMGVGGVSDFPDHAAKPWRNLEPRPADNFWRAVEAWNSTWGSGKQMVVDYVRVWAI